MSVFDQYKDPDGIVRIPRDEFKAVERAIDERDEVIQQIRGEHAERVEIAPGLECLCKWCKR